MLKHLKFKKTELSDLEKEIARLFEKLNGITKIDSDEYNAVSDQLAKLYKLKEIDSKRLVSPDTLVNAATNLAGILVVVNFEHLHAATSKAFNMILKPR